MTCRGMLSLAFVALYLPAAGLDDGPFNVAATSRSAAAETGKVPTPAPETKQSAKRLARPASDVPDELFDPVAGGAPASGAQRLRGGVRSADGREAADLLLFDSATRQQLQAAPMGQGLVPAGLLDRGFERFVDLKLLGEAWAKFDAALLTDAALQLAEGERVLLRTHRVLSSADALKLAAQAAIKTNDRATLERLAKVAAVRDDKELSALVAGGNKLAAASRGDSGVVVSPATSGAAEFLILQACSRDLERARLIDDAGVLQILTRIIPELPLLSAEQKERLLKLAKQPTPEPTAKSLQTQKTLHLLAGASRDTSHAEGGRYLATAEALADLEKIHGVSKEDRATAMSTLEKLRALARCDISDPLCIP